MILDTNILIAYLNGEIEVIETLSSWRRENRALFISSISVAEVLSLPSLSPQDTQKIKIFLSDFIAIPFDNYLAETVAQLRRKYKISIPDAVIAATALIRNAPLVTRDVGFRKVKELNIIEI